MTSTDDELVSRLQAHLSTIRKAAGWSGERLANELGITKQTVSSLETGKTQMTKMHYLAIRAVFNNEIAVSGNEDLAKIIQLFVDQPVAPKLEKMQNALKEGDEKGTQQAERHSWSNRSHRRPNPRFIGIDSGIGLSCISTCKINQEMRCTEIGVGKH